MRNYLILPILLLTSGWSQAGYFELTESTYTANQYIDVVNLDGSDTVGVNDIVRSVQSFAYTDSTGDARTALAISIARVSAENTLTDGSSRKQYQFAAPTGSESTSGPNSISSLVSAFTSSYSSQLKSTGATTSGGDTFALLTTSGSFSISSFNFDATNFGLTPANWSVDFTAGYASGNDQEWMQNYIGAGVTLDLDSVNTPTTGGFQDAGTATNFEQMFAYTITSVRDEFGVYTAGSGGIASLNFSTLVGTPSTVSGNIGTATSSNGLDYGFVGSQPSGVDFSTENVEVSLPAPGAVPEPSSILVLAGLGVLGMTSRRRKR